MTGRTDEAIVYYERSLVIDERVYGPDHPYVINTRNRLAELKG